MQTDRIPAEVKARSPFGRGFWEAGGWGLGMQVVTQPASGPAARVRLGGRPRHQRVLGPGERACGIHLTQRVMESPEPTAVFTDFWTRARAAAGV